MNLTMIKNFFLSGHDRKSIEPVKVGRVLRRSFRLKRPKQILESNREKRKSGKIFLRGLFERNFDAIIVEMISKRLCTNDSDSLKITSLSRFTDSFVNSQEWTISRAVPDLRLGIVGSLNSGKSALVHRYLTGSYMQEESPEGGRFKKEIQIDSQSYLLLIRDEGGAPEMQVSVLVTKPTAVRHPLILAFFLITNN